MKSKTLIMILTFIVGLLVGYIVYDNISDNHESSGGSSSRKKEESSSKDENDNNIIDRKPVVDSDKKLKNKLETIGKTFYEKYYYISIRNPEYLENFTEIGIKVDLDNLSRWDGIDSDNYRDVIKALQEKCDVRNTKVIIYPKSPYGKKDYKLEVELDCDV